MKNKRDIIKKELLGVMMEYLPNEPEPSEDIRLVKDLCLLGDDITEIILIVQKRLRIIPPLKEWNQVSTVGQAIDIFLKYAPENRQPVTAQQAYSREAMLETIRCFVGKATITDDTRLFHDLRLYGDDVCELFQLLEKQYGLNLDGLVFSTYFPSARQLFGFEGQKRRFKPLTFGHLCNVVQKGCWFDE